MRARRTNDASNSIAVNGKHPDWSQLLRDAVTKPGVISSAYSNFWNYSVGNQILAIFQCWSRRIEPGPIHTFRGWHELGRNVKKGERALTLCMPVRLKRKTENVVTVASDEELSKQTSATPAGNTTRKVPEQFTRFIYRNNWFVLSQTDGKAYEPIDVPEWSESTALVTLKIDRVPFQHTDGNCQGYARDRIVAVSPIAFMPHRTLFHELAHVMLGHTAELAVGLIDHGEQTPRDLREVEAECVAMICSESLYLPGADFSRGYIQHWISGQQIVDRSAQRIFKAADEILRAGRAPTMSG